jgi:hypothetical protein
MSDRDRSLSDMEAPPAHGKEDRIKGKERKSESD